MATEVDTAVLQVLVVDDHRTFAELLAAALQSQPDLNCVAKAYDADSAESLCAQINPDVVVVDVDMPGCDGITLAGRLTAGAMAGMPLGLVILLAVDEQVLRGVRGRGRGHQRPAERARLAQFLR